MAVNKIIIMFGQSYAVGRNALALLPAEFAGVQLNLRVFNGTGFECIDSTVNNNQYGAPSSQFSYEYNLGGLQGVVNEDIYLLKYAIGGTKLFDSGETWNAARVDTLFNNLKSHITSTIAWMDGRDKDYEFFGAIWDQGQSDANTLSYANAYEANQNALITALDAYIGTPLFWYITQLNDLDSRTYQTTVKDAKIASVAADTTKRRLISADGVTLGVDGIHPSVAGNELTGSRITAAILNDL